MSSGHFSRRVALSRRTGERWPCLSTVACSDRRWASRGARRVARATAAQLAGSDRESLRAPRTSGRATTDPAASRPRTLHPILQSSIATMASSSSLAPKALEPLAEGGPFHIALWFDRRDRNGPSRGLLAAPLPRIGWKTSWPFMVSARHPRGWCDRPMPYRRRSLRHRLTRR